MINSLLFICLDGWDPSYLKNIRLPSLNRIKEAGAFRLIDAAVPTLTNVNHVSMLTGAYPEKHGITGNYGFARESGNYFYIDSPEFIKEPLITVRFRKAGFKTVLLTVKAKLEGLLSTGMSLSLSAESAPPEWVKRFGPPGDIYSAEANLWLFKVACELLEEPGPKFIYLTSSDWITHAFGPGSPEANDYFARVDKAIGEILERFPKINLCVTADHGMNDKSTALDPGRLLTHNGIGAVTVPLIRDRYVVHHKNLGGACCVFLNEQKYVQDAVSFISSCPGVENAVDAATAASTYRLPRNLIGDIFILGDRKTVFGALAEPESVVRVRSHGSLHEQKIPFFGYGPVFGTANPRHNKDLLSLFTF
jgi:phosphonoacetate hydrolase